MQIFDNIKVQISEKLVLRLQGYLNQEDSPSSTVEKLLAQEIEEGYQLVQPHAAYGEMTARLADESAVVLEDGTTLNIGRATSEWLGLERVGLGLSTIGSALEERINQLFAEGDYAAAVMLDSVGSVAVGDVVSQIDTTACVHARERGMTAGPRLEPGVAGWDITDQTVLFTLLPAQELKVRLNKQCLMIPRKSVSFVIGMGKELPSPPGRHPCWRCNLVHCPFRQLNSAAAK